MDIFSGNANKIAINIVWFKRDLRFTDHEPLFLAQQQKEPLLLLYVFEPELMKAEDSDLRHWQFIYQSLQDMQKKLDVLESTLYIAHNSVLNVLEVLSRNYSIKTLYSHQETGNNLSFQRDLQVVDFCKKQTIKWHESPTNGVIRRLRSHADWEKRWFATMAKSPAMVSESGWNFVSLPEKLYTELKGEALDDKISTPDKNFQQGGETLAWRYLDSFLKERYERYSSDISKPALSRRSCSRLSPYLAYGNISMRMVFQYTAQHYPNSKNKRALENFKSRLHWHCHFIQSFEDHCWMEFENFNPAFRQLIKPKNERYIKAWQEGRTGVPIVDACMRCVVATGYINFRMRAMVVSFFVFNLWQDWRELHFLARQFLDYEPGIHYPQLQMQSGSGAGRTVRIYNPVKNSEDHDPDGNFIKKWLPELAQVPPNLIHAPWLLSPMEQTLYHCELGRDYPLPIVDIDKSRRAASDIVFALKKNPTQLNENSIFADLNEKDEL